MPPWLQFKVVRSDDFVDLRDLVSAFFSAPPRLRVKFFQQ